MHSESDKNELAQELKKNHSGRWTLVLLLVFFALPVVIVVAMHEMNVRPKGHSNGQMFSPSVPIELKSGLVSSTGKPINQAFWGTRWNLIYVTDECNQMCETRIHDARQIHLSLAKEIERAQRVLIAHQADFAGLQKKYPDLLIIQQADSVNHLATQFSSQSNAKQGLYLVDPLGNIVMFYQDAIPAKLVRADLLKLLKFSWAG